MNCLKIIYLFMKLEIYALRLNTLLDDLLGKISFVAALTVYRPARALGLMQIEIFNLPHCYLFWPRISTFNCLVFFV